jgi:hypothetical protein
VVQFQPGARLTFAGTTGERLTGTLMKFHRRPVTVITDDRQHWNICPRLLSPPDPVDWHRHRYLFDEALRITSPRFSLSIPSIVKRSPMTHLQSGSS